MQLLDGRPPPGTFVAFISAQSYRANVPRPDERVELSVSLLAAASAGRTGLICRSVTRKPAESPV